MGEQPNPWDLLQPQDATSRHRGAKPCRRCDALQFLAVQTIPLSLSRQWRVMGDVDLPLPAVSSISRRCEKSLQGMRVVHIRLASERSMQNTSGSTTRILPSVLPTRLVWFGLHRYEPQFTAQSLERGATN